MIAFVQGETVVGEPAECETLYLYLGGRLSNQSNRIISIGVLEEDAKPDNGTVSFQIVTFYPDKICDVATADLLENEIDLVIKGLKDAKKRMLKYKEQNK